jgi:hypothetical protein
MLRDLVFPLAGRRARSSSWDRTGANADHVVVESGASHALLDVPGAGIITHLWITVNTENPTYLRDVVLEMSWDGAASPAVAAPLGDFFALGHARMAPVTSLPITVVAGGASGARGMGALNCWFQMPFATGARVVVRNEGDLPLTHLFYYVDYDELPGPPATPLRFHAHYRQERPTEADFDLAHPDASWGRMASEPNLGGRGNYVLLDARGEGHYVGCTMSVDHLNPIQSGGWFGEGDDMIFIDGRPGHGAPPQPESAPGANDAWPPTLHGTGTEDYFGAAWGYPAGVQHTPFHGVSLAGEPERTPLEYAGKWTMYRFHLADPVRFERAIRVTIEHGHANCHADDYSSVAYWYQALGAQLAALPPAAERRPRSDRESLRAYLLTRQNH